MELGKIYKGVSVNEFYVRREGDSFLVSFSFIASDEIVNVNLIGVRDPDGLCEILSADRLWVEKSEDSQVEFGGYTLGVSHEYYTVIVFDALS
ncbi:hypothetical protein L2725_15405 [Shewanella corallii]|uniref:Uncharacterized protein n=2 Tax=Shewanella TaxID=22 RepID=A0ABT0N9L7_9GAMM|nr:MULTISPECIES: hypothetical protein [Shewanella]MCL1038829.1 hypothetical protein [Shewanella submarina]MCL2915146.1 hypothetical protein [Shewanella corallii]